MSIGHARVSLIVTTAICAAPAYGQAATEAEPATLDAVVVSGARKRVDNLQEVPQSATVLSREQVREARINTVEQLQAFVPNFRVNTAGGRGGKGAISIRGLSNTDFSKDPSVGVYIDDVPFTDLSVYSSILFDVESIEVLRGPQSTLYGANTPAGIINVVTALPSREFGGEAEVEYSSRNTLLTRARLTGPLGMQGLTGSLALIRETSDGFITNRFNDRPFDKRKTEAFRGKLRWEPHADWDANLLLQHAEIDDTGGPFHYVPVDSGAYAAAVPGAPRLGRQEIWQNRTDGQVGGKEWVGALRVNYHGEAFQLASITSHRQRKENFSNWDTDDTASPFDISPLLGLPPGSYLVPGITGMYDGKTRQTTQEFRIQSPAGAPESFIWLAGIYLSDSTENGYGSFSIENAPTPLQTADLNYKQSSQAVFGQSTWRFLGDRLGLTTGLRYETVEREGNNASIPNHGGSKRFDQWLPRIGMDWRFSNDSMAYVDVARGWKAGGFAIESPAGQPFRFDPEVVTNTEIGIKSIWLDGRLSLNAALFHMGAKDYQDTVRVDSLTRYLSNADRVRNRGLEIEAQWRPARQLELGATFGYLDAKYVDYANPDGSNFNGNRVVLTPKHSIGVNATWRAGNGLYARADVMQYSDYYFDRENAQRQPGYTLVNAKIGYKRDAWEVFAFGENLANAHYYERMFPGTMHSNLQFGSPEKPRRFGVGARIDF